MKKILILLCFVVITGALHARGRIEDPAKAAEAADISYAFGLVLGQDLKSTGLDFNYSALADGLRAAVEGLEPRYSFDEALEKAQTALIGARTRQAAENKEKEARFLQENGKREGVTSTASGLQYEILNNGTSGGEKPGPRALVRVNYEGKLVDGAVFDSTWERGEPAEIPLDRVIPGWAEGIQLMSVGSTWLFYIPSALAYGPEGAGQVIPPNSPLIFKVELLEILDDARAEEGLFWEPSPQDEAGGEG
jgi:FKBP-type peptidyl-prolyl cis-trans isomerase